MAVDNVSVGLRAMKMIAVADGVFDDRERRVLEAARDVLGGTADIDALAPIMPAEVAAEIGEPTQRSQLIAGLLVVAMADEDISEPEAAAIDAFATALGVGELGKLRRLVESHNNVTRFDLARRAWALPRLAEHARDLAWLQRGIAAIAGLRDDRELAHRYQALAYAPAGSLGRAYFDVVRGSGFSLPGERGGPPEAIALHDFTHALTGYGTDATGELQVAFFQAGCSRVDPFFFTFFVELQHHLVTPAGVRAGADAALARGAACSIDPLAGWDPWPVMAEPVDELRRRYGIA